MSPSAKRQAVGRPVAFAPRLWPADPIRLDDERELHNALGRGEIDVHFQPIVELDTGATIGYESLVRWPRGSEGIPAAEFIGMADTTGLIHELGTYMRSTLTKSIVEYRHNPDTTSNLWFFNVAIKELRMPGIAEAIIAEIDNRGLERNAFIVEFRGEISPKETGLANQALRALADAGVGIAIDDFGAGTTSLEVLRMLPLSWVKLAPNFTAEVTDDVTAARIIESMLTLADRLDIQAVVKGIETEEQRTILRNLGARFGQGHLFAEAAPLSVHLGGNK